VYGEIAKAYRSSCGLLRPLPDVCRLGYPTSDEQPIGTLGQRVSYFEGGAIFFDPHRKNGINIAYKR
jgi:LGFP repeat